ncbi:hypothetical protein GC170_22630 [bacterium]|nr:hypothetical protein [bacterium]
MDIWSLDKIFLFTLLAVPGFISLKLYDINTSGYYRDSSKQLIDIVTYSCLNLAFCAFPIYVIEYYLKECMPGFLYFIFYFSVIFVVPLFSAILLYWFRTTRFARKYLPHPLHRSWDFVFFNSQCFWVKIVLKSKEVLYGYYGENSFTSTDPAHYQIYLEQVWRKNRSGGFKEMKSETKGLIVSMSEISYMEFFGAQMEFFDAQDVVE